MWQFDLFCFPGLDFDFQSLHSKKKKTKLMQGKLFRPQLCSWAVLSVMCIVAFLLDDCQDTGRVWHNFFYVLFLHQLSNITNDDSKKAYFDKNSSLCKGKGVKTSICSYLKVRKKQITSLIQSETFRPSGHWKSDQNWGYVDAMTHLLQRTFFKICIWKYSWFD